MRHRVDAGWFMFVQLRALHAPHKKEPSSLKEHQPEGSPLPIETIFKAVAVLTVSVILVTLMTVILMLLNQGSLFPVAFEVISAFSNTGYSLGITDNFNGAGRFLLAFTMFWGRLGPLTLIVALAQRRRRSLIHYPEEKIIIG